MRPGLPILLLLLLISCSMAFGLGIAPAKTTIEFVPNAVFEKEFRITVDNPPAKVLLSTEGELGDYIVLDKTAIVAQEGETSVSYTLRLPDKLPPGRRLGKILAIQVPVIESKTDLIVATTAVVHQVWVEVPLTGKYAEASLHVTNTNVNESILFTIGIKNFGKEDLSQISGDIYIKGPFNNDLAELHTDSISLLSGQESQLTATWSTPNTGTYLADGYVTYDGNQIRMQEIFEVGSMEVELADLKLNSFRIGQIAKIDLALRNKWNQPIKAEGTFQVLKNGKEIATFNAIPVEIPPKTGTTISGFWNTEGIAVGSYDVLATVTFGGRTTTKMYNIIVSLDNAATTGSTAGNVVTPARGAAKNELGTITIIVIVLIVLNILFFIYIRKKVK